MKSGGDSDEMVKDALFDTARLDALAQQAPPSLRILRLRLRFALPRVLALGQRFRLLLELVDEMGQPVVLNAAQHRDFSVDIALELEHLLVHRAADITLVTRELPGIGSSCQQQQHKRCIWCFDAEFVCTNSTCCDSPTAHNDRAMVDNTTALHATISLRLLQTPAIPQSEHEPQPPTSAFHTALERFCVNSTWLDASTLVLALTSATIDIIVAADASLYPASRLVNNIDLCSRSFTVDYMPPSGAMTKRRVVALEEDYGNAMGSHIWDASVLFAFALVAAGDATQFGTRRDALELGAGCGLVAVVIAALQGLAVQDNSSIPGIQMYPYDIRHTIVATERSASLALLASNVQRNAVATDVARVSVVPLEWGDPLVVSSDAAVAPLQIDTVVAADVLYNWSAHEPLLQTLETVRTQQQQQQPMRVVVAHKHRSEATSAPLERVLQGDIDACDRDTCAWQRWRVTRIARLGAVDLLLLTPRQ